MVMTKEKLQALEQLVQEQLEVIKEKSGKWRMVTDLRAMNKIIEPMGSLHP